MKTKITFFFLLIQIFSCKKDKDTTPTLSFLAQSGGVYISNEGLFQSGNSSISYYNPSDHSVISDVYQPVNAQSLGDICQSMSLINGSIYAVVNNSGKIEVCDPYTMKRKATITGLTSPRYMLAVSNSKAYVSDLYSNTISVVNTVTNTIQGSISLPGSTEQMLLLNQKVYATNMLSDYVSIIDASNDIITDSIPISKGANSICADINGKLWISCGGDYQTVSAALYRIDPVTKQIEFSRLFSPTDYVSKLCVNRSGDKIYFLNGSVWEMKATDMIYPSNPFIQSSGNNFYGLAIDTVVDEIYVSDAINFSQEGRIFRYGNSGNLLDNFKAGINPGDFLFLR